MNIEELKQRAEAGDAEAMCELGWFISMVRVLNCITC